VSDNVGQGIVLDYLLKQQGEKMTMDRVKIKTDCDYTVKMTVLARRAVECAEKLAEEAGLDYIGSDHLLRGLVECSTSGLLQTLFHNYVPRAFFEELEKI